MNLWQPAPCLGQFAFARERVRAEWSALHATDALPCPASNALLDGWALLHAGLFERAMLAGQALPYASGAALACRARACHTVLVERNAPAQLQHLQNLHLYACTYAALQPRCADAWFWQGWALTQYVRLGGIAPALAQGMVMPAFTALHSALALQPRHAYARLTLGVLQSSVLHAMGRFGALMGYGVRAEGAIERLRSAVRIAPASPAVLHEAAHAMLLLGKEHAPDASALLARAAALHPRDASEWLWLERVRTARALENAYS